MAKSNEPIWWLPFMAGAGVAALVMPALIFVIGIALPFVNGGLIPSMDRVGYNDIAWAVEGVWARLFLFVVISLSLFHWAHRFRYTLVDLGLHGAAALIAFLCYASAIIGTGVAAWAIWS